MMKKRAPERMCGGCMSRKMKSDLLRLAKGADGNVHPDPEAVLPGRGVYLCMENGKAKGSCLEQALKRKAIQRGLRMSLTDAQIEQLRKELEV